MRFRYTAKRSLISGHVAETEYDLIVHGAAIDPSRRYRGEAQEALDGSVEANLHRIERYWSVQTDHILGSSLPQWHEFLDSVAARETFTFDPYAMSVTEVSPVTAWLDTDRVQPRRVGVLDRWVLAFTVREV